MRDVLIDTIRLLCRTGIDYSRRLRVQGLLGITVDDEHVFLIHVDDFIARNCTDVDNSVCGYDDECTSASRGRDNSDTAAARLGSMARNISQDIHGNCTRQNPLGPLVQYPKHLSLSQSTHNNVLTSVAMTEISSAIAASDETPRDLPSSQMLSQSTQNAQLHGTVAPSAVVETCTESVHFASNGNAVVTKSHTTDPATSVNAPQNEVASNNKNEEPVFVKMEFDARDDVNMESTLAPASSDMQTDMAMCLPTVVSEHQQRLSNLDDIDSSSADTNEDGDSDRTSESDEAADHLTLPRLELISSLQYKPQPVVGNASRWQMGGVQHGGSDPGTDQVTIQPAVLTGVVQTGSGSHASTYYQQQVVVFILIFLTAIHSQVMAIYRCVLI